MTRHILFVQGGGSGAHDAWDNHLVDDLQRRLGPDFAIRYPRLPQEDDPDFARWSAALADELASLEDDAIIVAHSIGATILINAIAKSPPAVRLGGIFLLAAPFIGPGGWPSGDVKPDPKLGDATPKGVPIFFYHGSSDDTASPEHAELYARAVPQAVVRRLAGRDHQLNNDLTEVAADIRSLAG
ncbi:alpha/beta fold hydrolase [Devosia sp.]|uniref:alpha/beta fold hydrolase n=1 Tax=Devosia sp. TaxID=1871048 RepID=UPI0032635E46